MSEKENTLEKWNLVMGKMTNDNTTDLASGYIKNTVQDELDNSESIRTDFSDIMFPMVRRISASTIGGGGMRKSNIQQLKENRINKIRLLEGKIPNIVLPDDEHFGGLISVTPMSSPSVSLFYMDYSYDSSITILKKNRISKLDKINISFRRDKLEYIEKIIKKHG